MKDISKRIKELRLERNMTQDDLAERLHVTRQTVSSWETKKTRPDVETLEAIAQVFEIELTELLYGKKKQERSFNAKPSNPKMVKQAKIFGIIFVVGFISRFAIVPLAAALGGLFGASVFTAQLVLALGTIVLGNWSFACLGPFVLSLISIKNDVAIQNAIWRKRTFCIGSILAATAILIWPLWIMYSQLDLFEVGNMISSAMAMLVWVVFQNRYILLIIASLIWLGKKEPAEAEKASAEDTCAIEIE